MKKALLVVLTVVFGAVAGCSYGTSQGGDSTSSPSPSSPESAQGVDSHVFEGAYEDDYVSTDRIELYGQYDVEWEVEGNGFEDSQRPSYYEIQVNGVDFFSIDTGNVADGSGTERIEVDSGLYYARVFFGPEAEWKITFTRTCNGLPPDCPAIED